MSMGVQKPGRTTQESANGVGKCLSLKTDGKGYVIKSVLIRITPKEE